MSIMESSRSFSWIYKFTDDMTKILPQLNQSCLYFRKGHQILNQGSAARRILLLQAIHNGFSLGPFLSLSLFTLFLVISFNAMTIPYPQSQTKLKNRIMTSFFSLEQMSKSGFGEESALPYKVYKKAQATNGRMEKRSSISVTTGHKHTSA